MNEISVEAYIRCISGFSCFDILFLLVKCFSFFVDSSGCDGTGQVLIAFYFPKNATLRCRLFCSYLPMRWALGFVF